MTPDNPHLILVAWALTFVGAVWAFVVLCCAYAALSRRCASSYRRP